MAQILIRGLDQQVVDQLKNRAALDGRSLESEVRSILESAASFSAHEIRRVSRRWQEQFAGRKMADSVEFLREDRRR